jgi:hypothetical protein
MDSRWNWRQNPSMTIRAHFDGRTLVPDELLDLPMDCRVELEVRRIVEPSAGVATPLQEFAARLAEIPDNPDSPADGAMQHDHYLYGTPKRARGSAGRPERRP